MPDPVPRSVKHPLLLAYAERQGLGSSAFLSDGSLSLIFDAAYRLQVRPFVGDRLVVQSWLLEIAPIRREQRDELLVRLLRHAASTARDFPAGLVVDATASWLLLQQVVPAGADLRTLEAELADFVNVRAYWQGRCSEEAKRSHA